MVIKLKNILLIIVLLCYTQAVFEVNTDTITNTWNDDCDTYVLTENKAVEQTIKKDKVADEKAFLPQLKHTQSHTYSYLKFQIFNCKQQSNNYSQKLYISNCSWLI